MNTNDVLTVFCKEQKSASYGGDRASKEDSRAQQRTMFS